MTDLKTLKQLIRLMVDNDLTELDVEGEGQRIKLKRGGQMPEVQYVHTTHPAGHEHAADQKTSDDNAEDNDIDDGIETIDSPMVGTFYAASSPDAKPFVSVGDRVTPDTLICIIEAMKVFNEIKADVTGVVQSILVENGQAVEFDQPLFKIKVE